MRGPIPREELRLPLCLAFGALLHRMEPKQAEGPMGTLAALAATSKRRCFFLVFFCFVCVCVLCHVCTANVLESNVLELEGSRGLGGGVCPGMPTCSMFVQGGQLH